MLRHFLVTVNYSTGDVIAAGVDLEVAGLPPVLPGTETGENYGRGNEAEAAKDALGTIMPEADDDDEPLDWRTVGPFNAEFTRRIEGKSQPESDDPDAPEVD